MRIVFFSNYFNHHQKALCDSLSALPEVEFTFVETEPMEEFRKSMGWDGSPEEYVLSAYKDEESEKRALALGLEAEVVIIGSAPERYIEKRLEKNSLTFRYTERPMKEGRIKMFIPRLGLKFYRIHYKNRNRNIYLLGASAFAAADYAVLRSYPGRCLKFGYFPEGESMSKEQVMGLKNSGEAPLILWTGRFLKLKRADLLIKALWGLKMRGDSFRALLVGDGETKDTLVHRVKAYGLEDMVTFMPFVKPEEVRELMRRADIYVMTSNFLEGWGSVIYEALSEGCGVVASHACGCTNWLVKHGETGLVFKSGNEKSLEEGLHRFLKDEALLKKCQDAAFSQMKGLWNPQVAAQRIAEFSASLLSGGGRLEYEDGPLSRAQILENDWFREE